MGKGRPRAVEKGVLGHSFTIATSGYLNIPQAPVYYPTEDEFRDPLVYIEKIRLEAESYGICQIVPPKSWKPPFALDVDSLSFPTKSQAIHQLQARAASCDPKTFELEYNRFLENRLGKKPKKKATFEGQELDLCKLFNAVKRYGGYDKVAKDKKWGDVFRFVCSAGKITECSKHVLCQLYREHLSEYEDYLNSLNNKNKSRNSKRPFEGGKCNGQTLSGTDVKKRRKNFKGEKIKVAKVESKTEYDQICEQCKSGLHGEVMLLCDRCDKGWHLYCLSPPLEQVPSGNWYCLECVNSNKDSFGFVPGKCFTMEAFRRMADRGRRKWFGNTPTTRAQLEKKFWEIVEGSSGEVEVMYGSDLDTSLYGSGFPRLGDPSPPSVDPEIWRKYSSSPWNLNNLPKLQGSMLTAVRDNIAGVMVPWLYVGMLFSSFCWHFEDHCFYSMNYLHWGEPKCWYSVPGSEADTFEQVMRRHLPDLFDVQPDLLFQLVTMLNPSVLRESGVPVYGVLQEPGSFVITFPRSYHGGFNLGLNCAEAVNFAPADWLPHGGYGAELYRMYHKAAVLSHEELLCVVAKGNCEKKVYPYLKEELVRIFTKEKHYREVLWRQGIIKSCLMPPRKHPEYVGTEEDPTCIICHQYLYLSAVVCNCRPTAFVCLEHWEHLCECKPQKHSLLYRHTLAELDDLLLMVTPTITYTCKGKIQNQFSCSVESNGLSKKVKGGFVSFAQLAEDWVSNSCNILKSSFDYTSYCKALKDAEQFLWAGHEMDLVRNMASDLVVAQKWALGVRNCLAMVVSCLNQKDGKEKVSLREVENFLKVDPAPCYEPGLAKLKVYAEEARMLLSQIKPALSSHLHIMELEILHSEVAACPIYLEENVWLEKEISLVKTWLNCVKECLLEKKPASVEVNVLFRLKMEMTELHSKLPEMEMLLDLLRQVESWQARCIELLNGQPSLQELGAFLEDADSFIVNIPELKLLRQYYSDALSWISRFNDVMRKVQENEDHNAAVVELTCLMNEGCSLRIQVDELDILKTELKKSHCREKALKALATQMPLDFIHDLMTEASLLGIEAEVIFVNMSGVLHAALLWEEKAKSVLLDKGQMSEFEDCIRTADGIPVVLPSFDELNVAVSMAESWIKASYPFLESTVCTQQASKHLLNVDALKELVDQSKFLKVSLEGPEIVGNVLKNVETWEHESCSLLEEVNSLFTMDEMVPMFENTLVQRMEDLMSKVTAIMSHGFSLGFDFPEMSKLQNISSTLRWSLKVLAVCSTVVSLEEVESLIEEAEHLVDTGSFTVLIGILINEARWIKQACMMIPGSGNATRYKLKDVEAVLEKAERLEIRCPAMVTQLVAVIEKHKSWQEKVNLFFGSSRKQSWAQLLELKDLGGSEALDGPELDRITSDVAKVEKWIMKCKHIIGVSTEESLLTALMKIKSTWERALYILGKSESCGAQALCLSCCSASDNEVVACLTCKDRYHLSCMGPLAALWTGNKEYMCPFCLYLEVGAGPGKSGLHLISRRKRPRLKMFMELLHDLEDFYDGIEERDVIKELVERALMFKSHLTKTVELVLSYAQKDLSSISKALLMTLKMSAMAGVYDHEDSCNLQLAVTRNSWKLRVKKLLDSPGKPSIKEVQLLLKEGVALHVMPEDYYLQKLTEVQNIGLRWASIAKKVAADSGALELDEVLKLIREGEHLAISFEKELKLLRVRSELYCICRKPYDQRPMIACDRCDEWYHFDCINLMDPPPGAFICAACKPSDMDPATLSPLTGHEERTSAEGPRTPPPRQCELKRRDPGKARSSLEKQMRVATDLINILRFSSEIDHLWRKSQRPQRRTARKRCKFESPCQNFHLQ